MSGILAGLALVNNFDGNGELMRGALLRIYAAGTTSPVTAYKDSALTSGQEHPWPLAADSAGRLPMFYLADGDYRVRLASADGSYIAYDIPVLSTVGPSEGGGGGGGGGVSPEVIFQTGDPIWLPRSGIRSGWARSNGRTIGNSTSGATERANADTQALFEYLYSEYSNTICPVVGGRGASATADFNAGKQITLLDMRFIIPVGLDDMGNVAAGRATDVPAVSGSATAPASVLGSARNTLVQANLPTVNFNVTIPAGQGAHNHQFTAAITTDSLNNGIFTETTVSGTGTTTTSTLPQMTGTAASGGSGTAFNNTPLVMPGTWYIKL